MTLPRVLMGGRCCFAQSKGSHTPMCLWKPECSIQEGVIHAVMMSGVRRCVRTTEYSAAQTRSFTKLARRSSPLNAACSDRQAGHAFPSRCASFAPQALALSLLARRCLLHVHKAVLHVNRAILGMTEAAHVRLSAYARSPADWLDKQVRLRNGPEIFQLQSKCSAWHRHMPGGP